MNKLCWNFSTSLFQQRPKTLTRWKTFHNQRGMSMRCHKTFSRLHQRSAVQGNFETGGGHFEHVVSLTNESTNKLTGVVLLVAWQWLDLSCWWLVRRLLMHLFTYRMSNVVLPWNTHVSHCHVLTQIFHKSFYIYFISPMAAHSNM